MEEELERKIAEADTKLAGLRDKVKPEMTGNPGICYKKIRPTDLAYLETNEYKVAAVKWQGSDYSGSGGIQFEGWIEVYFAAANGGEVNTLKTPRIVTRDRYKEYLDKRELWPMEMVKLRPVNESNVSVAWTDKSGNQGPRYAVDLRQKSVSNR